MDQSISISNSLSKGSVNEEMTLRRASMEDADSRLLGGESAEAISNESIEKGDELLETYKVTSDAILGGMGSVWRVHHKYWDVNLAMKRPQPKFFAEGSKHRKEEFVAECENWIDLGLHPNIVSCYYVREIGGVPTIFSEWMDGGSLRDRIRDGSLYEGEPDLVQRRVLDLAIQAARGLLYSHEKGLIHQDMKPGNLLLSSEWEAKVADFGLAKARSQLQGPTGYTLEYCPKEQARGETPAPWMDVYAWALTVLEMYAGLRCWKTGEEVRTKRDVILGEILGNCKVPMPEEMRILLLRCIGEDKAAGNGFFSRVLRKSRKIEIPGFSQILTELEKIYEETAGEPYPRPVPESVSDTADNLNNKALSFLDLHQEDVAEKLWEEALDKEPDHDSANFNLNLHLVRAEKKYLSEIRFEKTGSRKLKWDDYKELEQETGSVPGMERETSIPPFEFRCFFIHAALSGKEIVIGHTIDKEMYGEVGPYISRVDRDTGETLETDELQDVRALGIGIDRVLIRPGGDLAVVLLKDDTAALYDVRAKKLLRISGVIDFSVDYHYIYTFSRDGALLLLSNYDGQNFVLQIPSMRIHRLREEQWFVCRMREKGLLFRERAEENRDALFVMEGDGEYRRIFTFEEPMAPYPVIENDCDPDPFLCYTYQGSDKSFILDQDLQKHFVSKEFIMKLPKVVFHDAGSGSLYTLLSRDPDTPRDTLALWDLKRQVRLCTMNALPEIDRCSNLEMSFDPAERKLLLCEMNDVDFFLMRWYPETLPPAPQDTVPATYRLSQIKTYSERSKEQEALAAAKMEFDKCFEGEEYGRALDVFRACREIAGFSGNRDARSMEEQLDTVFQKSGLRTVLPAGTVTVPPECVLDGSQEVVLCSGNRMAIFVPDKPEQGILISRPDGTAIRRIRVPQNTIYATVRKEKVYAFAKNLKCRVYDLDGNLTETYESNPCECESVVILDLDLDGKNLLYAGKKDSSFLSSEWIIKRELASGQESSFTQRMHGEPCRFLKDGTVLLPEFIYVPEQYGEDGYEIHKIHQFTSYGWNVVKTYPVYYDDGLVLFKNCRIGMNQDRSMFFPEMDYYYLEDGGHNRVIFAYAADDREDPVVNDIYCSGREEEQVIMLPGGQFFGGCDKRELWLMNVVEDGMQPGFRKDIEPSRLLFGPDGLEFYLQKKEEEGGTWRRYLVEYDYDR